MLSEVDASKAPLEQLRDEQAKNALACFLKDIALSRTHSGAIETRKIFLSYAWDDPSNPSFINLQNFLKRLKRHFDDVGLQSFLDLFSMAGHIEGQMREGIQESSLIILMGTRIYSQKTTLGSGSNVNKELDYILEKAAYLKDKGRSKDCIIYPLVLETAQTNIFHRLALDYMISNISSWLHLERGACSMEAYIDLLTSLNPPGLLALAFKLDTLDCSHPWFKITYRNAQAVLKQKLKAIYGNSPQYLASNPAEKLYAVGQSQEKSRRFTAAFEAYTGAASKGHLKAKTCLGLFFVQGLGVAQDKMKAYHYFLEAAEQGHHRAMYNLARMFEKGDGVAQDDAQALVWYQRAFEAGNLEALRKIEKLRVKEKAESPQASVNILP